MFRSVFLALSTAVLACSPLAAQDWAQKMFVTTDHDFGTVAKGAKTQFEFVLKNPFVETVHIAGVQSSCGCTTPTVVTPTLKTYEQGTILATFNTHLFEGQKGATLTVTIDQPFYAQVQLHVRGVIRNDVIFNPGVADFGTLEEGTGGQLGVAVACAGRPQWQIFSAACGNPNISTRVVEHSRDSGQVVYHLFVKLDPGAPAGSFRDHLILSTNDPTTNVSFAVQGTVDAGVSISPSTLVLGEVKPGEKVTRNVVVKANRPFRIHSIQSDDPNIQFNTNDCDVPKNFHLIPVTYTGGQKEGRVTATIRMETDLGKRVPSLSASVVVSGH